MLKAVGQKEIVGTSKRGRLYGTEREIKDLLWRFLLPIPEGPRYAFRTSEGTLITIYRREDTAKDEWNIGGFDNSVVDKLKEVLPNHKILTNEEWWDELGLGLGL